ncbi:MAG: type II secretion system protein [Chloroflexi bacterium]|nr:MAG: type II secretion system protein [Chloroflexota bacterium]TMD65290.1 MAG: type II secretion system protein [Chloroflexota bacterium]
MLLTLLKDARSRSHRSQGGFTLVELLVVIAILGILAAIVLFNISGVSANAACNAMKTDGGTVQNAADIYYTNNLKYPDSVADALVPPGPANGDGVNLNELVTANLLHQLPPATESFKYVVKAGYSTGTVQGQLVPNNALCVYNP